MNKKDNRKIFESIFFGLIFVLVFYAGYLYALYTVSQDSYEIKPVQETFEVG